MNRGRTGMVLALILGRAGTISRMDCGAELTAIVQETLAALLVEAAQ